MVKKISKSKLRFFKHLMRDQGGNTIIFVGASLIPLLALIGGGVDASRGYMAKARLQQACDAATLAGRREVGNGTFTIIAQQQANRLFNANFEPGFLNSSPPNFTTSSTNNGSTVLGTASVSIPTVIMRIFGNDTMDITVNCRAALDIANADVTLVLDTTGSMSRTAANVELGTDANGNARPGSRMFDLRAAAKSFYRVLNDASNQTNSRIRYGFVPYSSTVNVGRLIANNGGTSLLFGDNPNDEVSYPTRRAVYVIPDRSNSTTSTQTFGNNAFLSQLDCALLGRNENVEPNNDLDVYFRNNNGTFTQSNRPLNPTGNPIINRAGNFIDEYSFGGQTGNTVIVDGLNRRNCFRNLTRTPTRETFDPNAAGAIFSRWQYENVSLRVSDYVNSLNSGNAPSLFSNLPSGFTEPKDSIYINQSHAGNIVSRPWDGCIMERTTIAAEPQNIRFNSNSGSIAPEAATDLDINAPPRNNNNRWAPLWPEVVFERLNDNGNSTQSSSTNRGTPAPFACPQEVRLLSTMSQTEFDNIIDSLKPAGNTYHDIGLIWGGRISSPVGIFSENVTQEAPNNGFVSRNLIFMTDGELVPNVFGNSAYGVEFNNPQIGPAGTRNNALTAYHNARFLAACESIKFRGIRIFVVAFGTELTTSLQTCASVNSAFSANDSDQLNDTFLQIASNIADLRLTN